MTKLVLCLIVLLASSVLQAKQQHLLPLGTSYVYEICKYGEESSDASDAHYYLACPQNSQRLVVKVMRIEITQENPTAHYVFQVQGQRTSETYISVKKLDQYISRNMKSATDQTSCEKTNGNFGAADGWYTIGDRRYEGCFGGVDLESRSLSFVYIPVISPLPYFYKEAGNLSPSLHLELLDMVGTNSLKFRLLEIK